MAYVSICSAYLPQHFEIVITAWTASQFGFSAKMEQGALVFHKGHFYAPPSNPITPSPESWQLFWSKLHRIGFWKWREEYYRANVVVLDGIQWEVDIQFGEKRIRSHGSNCYPLRDGCPSTSSSYTKSFSEFEKALKELCGIGVNQGSDIEKDVSEEDIPIEWQYYSCPRCGCSKAIEIIYGMPTGDAFKLSEEGKLAIGGCCQELDDPDRSCPDCKHKWNSERIG